jgi:glycosyltransferase involved in cell wall biosynthesis
VDVRAAVVDLPQQRTPSVPAPRLEPVRVDGRHLSVGGAPWRLRAVTYGSFLPREGDGAPFPAPARLRDDLTAVAAAGFNTVRTYSLPPADLLDAAEALGLRVLVGLHYDDWRTVEGTSARTSRLVRDAGVRAVDEALERLAGRRCVAAVVVGNEVPADLVRLHGPRRVERVLGELVARVHAGAPELLATYASYPSSEYLRVEGQDLACVNVFLDDPAVLRGYLQHLSVELGPLPLVVSELGVQAGPGRALLQADLLRAQLDVVDEVGCAGAAVFSLTDEWGVGGHPVDGWHFGLQDADRVPRPAFEVASQWAGRSRRDERAHWPRLSVVVCAYQEQERLGRCLDSLVALDYPDLEVLVCDDGSTDGTLEIAREYPFRVLELAHGGLSAARNAGTAAATGEVVAFLDADAACHPDWAYALVRSLGDDPSTVGTGGPNLPTTCAGLVARAVALSPGNAVEVLTGPDRAEHVPGCNSAFRRDALLASGGYLPELVSAGDDVDLCWRLLDTGGAVTFSAAAQVRHERRGTVRGYLRQQRGYGRAERMVSGRHPHRFNRWGHATWSSSLYGGPLSLPRLLPRVIAHGPAGAAAYQPVVGHRGARALQLAGVLVLPAVVLGVLGLLLGLVWPPALAGAAAGASALLAHAVAVAVGVDVPRDEPTPLRLRAVVVLLHLLQPLARARGGLQARPLPPLPTPDWTGDRLRWVDALHVALAGQRCVVRRGGSHDGWDLRGAAGPLLRCTLTTGVRWGRTPVLRRAVRPRPAAAAALVVAAPLLLALSPAQDALVVLAVAAAAGVELRLLSRRVRRAVLATSPVPGTAS